MTQNQIKISYLIKKLAYKREKGDLSERDLATFQRLIDYSLYLTYPEFAADHSKVCKEIEKRKRVKRRVNRYLKDMVECYSESNFHFVTLTFDDPSLSLKPSTRHKYVLQFLEASSRAYIANIDYGSKKQREHYHAVCVFKREFETQEHVKALWKYGFSSIKNCGINDHDDEHKNKYRISSYILKLTNHAGKLTAGKVFHSKFFKDPDELPF